MEYGDKRNDCGEMRQDLQKGHPKKFIRLVSKEAIKLFARNAI